jgi:hypothetical protein
LGPDAQRGVCNLANHVGARRARGESINPTRSALSAAEPAGAMTAARKVVGPIEIGINAFPEPDIRVPLRLPAQYSLWRYDGTDSVPAVPAPTADAIRTLHEVGGEPWPSMLSGYLQAAPLGELSVQDLLGLLAHLPGPPDTPRWEHLAKSTPIYWYRLMQARTRRGTHRSSPCPEHARPIILPVPGQPLRIIGPQPAAPVPAPGLLAHAADSADTRNRQATCPATTYCSNRPAACTSTFRLQYSTNGQIGTLQRPWRPTHAAALRDGLPTLILAVHSPPFPSGERRPFRSLHGRVVPVKPWPT